MRNWRRNNIKGLGGSKPSKKRKHPESELQRACVKWFRYQYPQYKMLLFAIPNGGVRSKIEAMIMQGEGVLSGVADIMLAVQRDAKWGFFIEMKAGTGKQSIHQEAFEKAVVNEGYKYEVCKSLHQFMQLINDYLK